MKPPGSARKPSIASVGKMSVKDPPKKPEPVSKPLETCFVAVCGPENAGKRTFFKQLEINFNGRYCTDESRQHFDVVVQRFVIENMRRVIAALDPGSLKKYDELYKSWDRKYSDRRALLVLAQERYEALSSEQDFAEKLRTVKGLDEWAPDYFKEIERISDPGYKVSMDDFVKLVPLEGARCDYSDVIYDGILYKFFDFDNCRTRPTYENYQKSNYKFVYIIDAGASDAELEKAALELSVVVATHELRIFVCLNKRNTLENMQYKDFTAFKFRDVEPSKKFDKTLSQFVDDKIRDRVIEETQKKGRTQSTWTEFIICSESKNVIRDILHFDPSLLEQD